MSGRGSILVIEDNATSRKLFRLTLESEGYSVVEAADAQQGIETLAREAFDVVMQDLVLPDMHGFDLVRKLRELPHGADVPIIAVSGFLSRLEEAQAVGMGFTALLVKPVEPSRLVEAIGILLPSRNGPVQARGSGRIVLVVNDDPVQLKLARLRLAMMGFEVLSAESGAEALQVAHARVPDVILSDVLMPEMDGFELCLKVRSDPLLRKVPLLLVSAHYGSAADHELARRVGANALVQGTAEFAEVPPALAHAIEQGAPDTQVDPAVEIRLDHAGAVSKQLEKQLASVSGMAQRCTLLSAEVALLSSVSAALANNRDPASALKGVLSATLDAAGISKGALYLRETERGLTLSHSIGFDSGERKRLDEWLTQAPIDERILRGQEPLTLERPELSAPARALLEGIGVDSAQIVPLRSRSEDFGLLVLGACSTDVVSHDAIDFAHTFAGQIVQALELERAFAQTVEFEQRFRQLAENTRTVFFLIDSETSKLLYVSPAYEQVWGRSCQSLYDDPASWIDDIHPDDRALVLGSNSPSMRRAGFDHEYRLLRPHSAMRWIWARGVPIRDVSGEVCRIAVTAEDITEHKSAEEGVRAATRQVSRKQARQGSLDLLVLAIATLTVFALAAKFDWFEGSTKWIVAHEVGELDEFLVTALFLLFGLSVFAFRRWRESQSELVGHRVSQNALQLLHEDLDRRVKQRTTELIGANQALNAEITQRKEVAEALRESEMRLRQIAESIREVFFLIDAASAQVLYISPAYEEVWGRNRQSVYANPQSWSDAIHPEDRHLLAEFNRPRGGEGRFDFEYRIVRPDDSIRWIHARGFPIIDETGQVYRIAGIAEDITEYKFAEQAISASEVRYHRLFDASPMPMWVYDLETLAFLAVNEAAIQHYGYSRAQFLAMTIEDIRPEADVPALRENLKGGYAEIDHAGIWHHRKRDGSLIDVEITSHEVDIEGRRAKLVLANDVTVRTEQERKIARLNRLRTMMGGISSAMLRLRDRDALLREACRVSSIEGKFPLTWVVSIDPSTQASKLLAYHGDDPESIALVSAGFELVAPGLLPSYRAARTASPVVVNDVINDAAFEPIRVQLIRYGFLSCAAFPLVVDRRVTAVMVLLAAERNFFDEDEMALLEWLTADISYALGDIEKSRRLDHLAYYDALTELANARLFHDRVEQFIAAARRESGKVCVAVLDLEHFTRINDSFGRAVGDRLLREAGARLQRHLVEPFALGRIGADTFAAASPRDNGLIATELRDRMLQAISEPFVIEGAEIRLSAQVGIAFFPTDGEDADNVFKNAEVALKLAKSSGDRYVYYSSEIHARIAQRLALEDQLSKAIDAQQFVLHYQARVDMISGELVGAEALIRWQHPDRGLVAPGEFISFAEETGLIVTIGAWVIRQVCLQQAAWVSAGIAVPVAVNVSSVQFEKGDLAQTVLDALSAHSLNSKYLELELTESAVMADPVAATRILQTLHKRGVCLALDDFGTGYSSLAHLKRFPFDSVKIDQSFVTHITSNPEDAAIAGAIIAMAHSLNLKVVAEGIETQGQFNFLRAQGCDGMQGFYFSAAVPKEEFEAQLRAGKRVTLPAPVSGEEQTLLVVDDEPGIRSALTRTLRRDGYRILSAPNGAAGLEVLAVNHVQVIISDQRMPGMTGTEFLNIVKQLYPDTVRIILSGYTDLEVVTDSVNRGAVFKFLTKPWEEELLRDQVRDAFRRYQPEERPVRH